MWKHFSYFLLLAFGTVTPAPSCDCRGPQPACVYLSADAIFLCRVSFTNDDGSGRFAQATLVRFDVEEGFKGVEPEVHQIWVDPGSFSTCYEEYRPGQRCLIFATRKDQLPGDAAAMTIMRGPAGAAKPNPPGFDPAKPPPVYYAPECAGSRPADGFPKLDQDLAMLRAYRAGQTLPRVLGHVYLFPFRGWPDFTGPPLKGARVMMSNGSTTLSATTDGEGNFSVADAPSGYYKVWADLPPFRMDGQAVLDVREVGCGYKDIPLRTTSTIQGVVLDHRGRPAPKIPVLVRLKDYAEKTYGLDVATDSKGQFAITGLPDSDVYLSAGSDYPRTDMPYRGIYYPQSRSMDTAAALRLKPGEHRESIGLKLDAPLERTG